MTTYKFSDYGIIVDNGRDQQRVSCPECTPYRQKKNIKDLAVNIKEGIWLCHHCGWKGSLKLNRIEQEMKPQKKVYKKPAKILSYDLPENVLKYWGTRGISYNTLKKCGVTFERSWMPQTEKEENCTVFNYWLNGELINKKYRTGKKHHKLAKDAKLVFYAPMAKQKHSYSGDLYITEGEPDCLSMIELGFDNTISPPNGAPPENVDIKSQDFSYMDSLIEIMPKYDRVFLVMDTDGVGARFRDEIARRIGLERCFRAEYPEGCKDINDVLVKFGSIKATEIIRNCKPYPIEGKFDVSDFMDDIGNLYENGFEKGSSIGWDSIDKLYTVRPKEFTIITGIPSHGKSSFLDHTLVNLAKNKGWKFGIFSPENFPFARHVAKLSEIYIGKPFDKHYSGYMSKEELTRAVGFCNDHFHFIMPNEDDNQTLDKILDLAKASIFKDGINGLIIDPWNEIEHKMGKGEMETNYISKSLSKIRRFCRVNNIHVWIVAHPTKLVKIQAGDKKGQYPVPTPYDISGGAHWRNKADNCVCIHLDFETKITTFFSQKVRFKEVGKVGNTDLKFNIANGRYAEV